MKKIEPSVMTLTFPIRNVDAGLEAKTIDLSQAASLVNRRFYRQGLNWAVSGFTLHSTAQGTIQIEKIPNTWVTSNGWEKAFRAWDKQQKEAIEDSGSESAMARFRDFKVHMDTIHISAGFAGNFLPAVKASTFGGAWTDYTAGEWDASQIVLPNTIADASGSLVDPKEYRLHMVGTNNFGSLSKGVIEGYADSRAYPQSPDPVSPNIASGQNWLREMFDVGNDTSEVTENATDNNDELPYPQVDYPNGEVQAPYLHYHDQLNITATTVSGKTSCRGSNFPCGLVRLVIDPALGQQPGQEPTTWIQIHLVPGTHRGYLCEPMTDM
jgi:hypothetical protein